jgi:hypothetical protein
MRPITSMICDPPRRPLGSSEPGLGPLQKTKTADLGRDSVEISEPGLGLSALERGRPGRADRVAQVRAAVRRHRYITSSKIEWVVSWLLDELRK